jgi:hypothetical protein
MSPWDFNSYRLSESPFPKPRSSIRNLICVFHAYEDSPSVWWPEKHYFGNFSFVQHAQRSPYYPSNSISSLPHCFISTLFSFLIRRHQLEKSNLCPLILLFTFSLTSHASLPQKRMLPTIKCEIRWIYFQSVRTLVTLVFLFFLFKCYHTDFLFWIPLSHLDS